MAAVEIRKVQNKKDLLTFIKLPLRLYRDEPYYIPHLISDRKKFLDTQKNPFFDHAEVEYFLAYADGKPAGRIAAIINHLHNQYHHDKIGFFGFFDTVNNIDVAQPLLGAAEDFARNEGMEAIRGPANFSTNDEVGLLVEGFGSYPCFMMTYNPPYYAELYDKLGLEKAEDLIAHYIDAKSAPSERIKRVAEKIRARNRVRVRTINMSDFDNELNAIRTIYNSAWSKNWGFVPMTEEEFRYTADDFKRIVDPDLVLLAFIDNEPAGFSMALPDYNQVFRRMNGRLFPLGLLKFLYFTRVKRIITGLRLLTMGIIHKYQKLGLDLVFFIDTYHAGIAKGYRWAEISWVLERNTLMNKGAADMGARPYKRYRIYQKSI